MPPQKEKICIKIVTTVYSFSKIWCQIWMEIDLFSEEVFKRQQSYVHVFYFGYCCSISFDHQKILCKEYDWNMANSSEEVLGRFFIDLKCKKNHYLATCTSIISPWKRLLCAKFEWNWLNGLEKKLNSMTTMIVIHGPIVVSHY